MDASTARFLAGSMLAGFVFAAPAPEVAAQQLAAQKPFTPDFSSNQTGWVAVGELTGLPGGPPLLRQDPAHPFVPNNTGRQPTYRVADLTNPNLTRSA